MDKVKEGIVTMILDDDKEGILKFEKDDAIVFLKFQGPFWHGVSLFYFYGHFIMAFLSCAILICFRIGLNIFDTHMLCFMKFDICIHFVTCISKLDACDISFKIFYLID